MKPDCHHIIVVGSFWSWGLSVFDWMGIYWLLWLDMRYLAIVILISSELLMLGNVGKVLVSLIKARGLESFTDNN